MLITANAKRSEIGGRLHIKIAFVSDCVAKAGRRIVRGRRARRKNAGAAAETPKENRDIWFCCLMKQLEGQCKNETSILVSQKPLETVYAHNAGTINDKSTKAARGYWMPEMLVGPLPSEEDALRFKKNWMNKSRGISSKRQFGIDQSEKWRRQYPFLRCYDKRCIPAKYNAFLVDLGMPELCVPAHSLAIMNHRLLGCLRDHENTPPKRR